MVPADEAAFTVTLFAGRKGKGDRGSNAVPVAIEGSDTVKIPEALIPVTVSAIRSAKDWAGICNRADAAR
jgi:hypothetical protein